MTYKERTITLSITALTVAVFPLIAWLWPEFQNTSNVNILVTLASYIIGGLIGAFILRRYKVPCWKWLSTFAIIESYFLSRLSDLTDMLWFNIIVSLLTFVFTYVVADLIFNVWETRLRNKTIVAIAVIAVTALVIAPLLAIWQLYQLRLRTLY